MEKKQLTNKRSRISRFALVGIFNTLLDFTILNILVLGVGLPRVGANIISSTVAMVFSYFLNHNFVFKNKGQKSISRFITFIAITAVGTYGLQSLIIYLLTKQFTGPAELCFNLTEWLLPGIFSEDFVTLNFAKVVATIASLIWNYVLYAKFVFKADRDAA